MWHSSNIWKRQENKNLTQEKIKRRLYSGNASYHSVQKLLSSGMLSKIAKMKFKIIIIHNWWFLKTGLAL
jgi:hypothetical protein